MLVQSPLLLQDMGRTGRSNYLRNLTIWLLPCLEFVFFVYSSSDWSQLNDCSLNYFNRTLFCSQPLSRLHVLLCSPQPWPLFAFKVPLLCSREVGRTQFNVAPVRGRSTLPALGGPCSTGAMWMTGSVHLMKVTHPIVLQVLLHPHVLWHQLHLPLLWLLYLPLSFPSILRIYAH